MVKFIKAGKVCIERQQMITDGWIQKQMKEKNWMDEHFLESTQHTIFFLSSPIQSTRLLHYIEYPEALNEFYLILGCRHFARPLRRQEGCCRP